MRKKIFKFFSVIFCIGTICACAGKGSKEAEEEPIPAIGFRASDYSLETYSVKKNETLPVLLKRIGLPSDSVTVLLKQLDTLFNPRKMKIGQKVEAYYSGDSLNRRLEYAVYSHSKTKVTVFKCADSLYLWNYYKPVEHQEEYVDVLIDNSLWADLTKAGAPAELAIELADIFAWTVNFFGLQKGDRFQTIYTKQVCEGEVIAVDHVDFCRYTRAGSSEICAIRMDIPGSNDKYFNQNGENLRKAFLKAPLKFTRVSSKFSLRRKHPVTGQIKPHTGVDYAAPLGTPVVALGDGTVISAGWTDNGGGNVIKIKHNSVYTTGYLHLKGFASGIKKGAKVRQGQVIGYVGSTGRSTGPHLDFRVWRNGSPIDPLTMKSPAAEPLPAAYKPELDSLYTHYISLINGD
ncbi:MAG: peptidoglycan DD-metalloendopeptidase family protein [Candidatus Cryptobacteroides sp.]